jgi:hypothetical protein
MASRILKYGALWLSTVHPVQIEFDCIRKGGRWVGRNGLTMGMGMVYHYKQAISLIWPEIVWHRWNNLILEKYLKHRTIGIIGPASSGKTHTAAVLALMDYYPFPSETTIICCSTTKEMLEQRIWGEIKSLHRKARERIPWIPGHLIEGRLRILSDQRNQFLEGRDFRNGLIGVPCKKGDTYIGLGDFAGMKNKRVRLFGDELSLLPRVFVDAISNLDKNDDFKGTGLGNPKETTDALGLHCEPAAYLGGWDGGIDQTPETKSWETRRPMGICIQLCGTDSPNLDGKLGIPLITQEQIDRDVAFYGIDSQWFTMMNQGMMPKGQGSRRVITRQMCLKFGAMDEPNWAGSDRIRIGFLDAAYRGVGGDRCVFGELQFGYETPPADAAVGTLITSIINQKAPDPKRKQILALIGTVVVPIRDGEDEIPEDQIAKWCRSECEARGISPENFFFDVGMRSTLVSSFARIWSEKVNPIDCGGTASERPVSSVITKLCKDFYSKFVSELWYSVRMVIEAAQFRGMTEDVMLEGCAREWTRTAGNKIEVEPKEKMKLKTGRSPDLFDGLAVGVEGARRRGFAIAALANVRQKRNGREKDWRDELTARAVALSKAPVLNHEA